MKALGLFLTSFFCALTVYAGQVDQANVATFNAGETASAEDVNGNFAALISAINDNASRIAALEAGGGTGGSISNSVAGHTYFVFSLSQIHRANTNTGDQRNYQSVGHNVASGTITFGLDGTATVSFSENETELGLFSGFVETPDPVIILEGNLNQFGPNPFSGTPSFTQDGETVEVVLGPDDSLVTKVSADGMIMTNADLAVFTEQGFNGSESAIFVGIRIQ